MTSEERTMESMPSFTEEDLSRKLERVFEIFARAQEDRAMAYGPNKSTGDIGGDMEKEYGVSV